jgi:hypothetical protein
MIAIAPDSLPESLGTLLPRNVFLIDPMRFSQLRHYG